MTLSAYRSAPRIRHLERAKHLIGYLVKNRNGMVRICTDPPDFSGIEQPAPKQLVEDTICWCSRSHRPACTRTLGKSRDVYNFRRRQPLPLPHTRQPFRRPLSRSEFVAARIATDQIVADPAALRYLGVHVEGHTILYGDNRPVVDNCSTIPHSRLNKRHIALSYHRVREAICANIMTLMFVWLDSKHNPADILSKHSWSRQTVCDQLHSLLFMPSSIGESYERY
jgi:hypothetical protein